ncbi:unnamed protein product [Zymoseptoria tritici ST99CH_3D7]|uniref:F-box domain-containing protein n=1 Tax=Zymoseptoria tritici (strain ST99CH_3D7) TaxID=1276538 RepID=A0A1X7RZZ8_ZYMT9|nr:unnamed protein product [Zymoseptoria tritici ST99CH_3D7]
MADAGTTRALPPQPLATMPAPLSAAAQFFGIYEMVEQVMQYMEPAHILRSQTVSRTFREVVRSSPSVQIAAYLRPPIDARRPIWQVVYRGSQPFKIIYHPCRSTYRKTMDRSMAERVTSGPMRHIDYTGENGQLNISPAQPNPSILRFSKPLMTDVTLCGCPTCIMSEDVGWRFREGENDRQPRIMTTTFPSIPLQDLVAKNSSCLGMFLSSPPITRATIILALTGPETIKGVFPTCRHHMARPGGITVRHLLEAAERRGPKLVIHSIWPHGDYCWATEQTQERVRLWEVGAPCKKVLRDKAMSEQEVKEQEVRKQELKQEEVKAQEVKEKALATKELEQREAKAKRVKEAERRDRKLKEAEFKANIMRNQESDQISEAKKSCHRPTAPHTLAKCLISDEGRVKAKPTQSSDWRGFTFGA